LRQFLERAAGDFFFGSVVTVIRNALQLQASTIQARISANAPVPTGVVPGNANGDVTQWKIHCMVPQTNSFMRCTYERWKYGNDAGVGQWDALEQLAENIS
jgi:hypothetical protein